MNKSIGYIFTFIFLSAVCLNISACKDKNKGRELPEIKPPTYNNSAPGEEGMKNAVLGYQQTMIDAHLSDLHIKFIKNYATEDETRRVFIFINIDREKGEAMAMRLNKLVFDNISTSEKEDIVDTTEHWDYHNLEIKTSKPVEPVKELRYKLRYVLVKKEGKWLVDRLREREKPLIGEYNPPRWSLKGK